MAGFRRDRPIDPLHERDICLSLAEYHDERAAVMEGEDRADHERAARSCRDHAAEWEAKAQTAPASHALQRAAQIVPPKPQPAKATPAKPAKADGGQGALF